MAEECCGVVNAEAVEHGSLAVLCNRPLGHEGECKWVAFIAEDGSVTFGGPDA